MDDLEIKISELTENPSARVPVCLCLDVSGSMEGAPLRELNDGLTKFFQELRSNKLARYSADVCVVTFGASVSQVVEFGAPDRQRMPVLGASGATPMGEAVRLALDSLDFRKRVYQTVGVDYYQPWLVLMTDGQPTDDIEIAVHRVTSLVSARKLTVFPIAIGQAANLATLGRFTPGRAALRLNGLAFSEFFAWLSKSIVRTSSTSVGESVTLPPVTGWATL